MNDKNRKAMFAKNRKYHSDSFYKDFWDNGADGLFEWYNDVADDARLSKKDFDHDFFWAGLRPDWNDISKSGQSRLKKVISTQWGGGDNLKPNPKFIQVKAGWNRNGEGYSTNWHVDPNSYKNLEHIPEPLVGDIVSSFDKPDGYYKTNFKEDSVTLDQLRKMKQKHDQEFESRRKQ
jgi:hypothetical protein